MESELDFLDLVPESSVAFWKLHEIGNMSTC